MDSTLLRVLLVNAPKGAFYLFPSIASYGVSANDFAARILEEQKVAIVPGEGFGAPGYMRLSCATSDDV